MFNDTFAYTTLGGSNFRAAYSFEGARSSSCSSVAFQADKSNYWKPNLYWIDKVSSPGKTQFASLPANARFYYFLNPNNGQDRITLFPDGLRILAGDPFKKTPSNFIGFDCFINPDLSGYLSQDNFNFPRDCPYGMKSTLNMPNCWDGINLWKAGGTHMSYPAGNSYRGGACPYSHPIKIPQIMLEYTWFPSRYMPGAALAGNLAWANGDTTGYGLHGDFVNGWDRDVLAASLNDSSCVGSNTAIDAKQCNTFMKGFDEGISRSCKPDAGVLKESFGNDDLLPIPRLPGCNPLWASGPKPTCDPPIPPLDATPFLARDGSYIAVESQQRNTVLPTKPGWKEIACISSQSSFINATSYVDRNLSQTRCTASCLKSGYQYAAVGNHGDTCVCASGIADNAPVATGLCTTPCAGNSSQSCGGEYIFSVLYTAPGLDQVPSDVYSLGCYQNADDGLISKSSYTYYSSSMTTQECSQSCVDRNATWSLTTKGKNCYCGDTDLASSFGSGQFISSDMCRTTCAGNSSEFCGDNDRSNVYNLANSGLTKSVIDKPEGWLGCYAEGSGTRALTDNGWSSQSMTPKVCANSCSEMGYMYAAVEYSTRTYLVCVSLSYPTQLTRSFCVTHQNAFVETNTREEFSYLLANVQCPAKATTSSLVETQTSWNYCTLPFSPTTMPKHTPPPSQPTGLDVTLTAVRIWFSRITHGSPTT